AKMENWGEVEAAAYNELLDQSEFDAINILYVAFTRASQQLYILSCAEPKKAEVKSEKVSGVLINYLKSVNKWDGSHEYEFGSNEMQSKKDRASVAFDPPAAYYSTPVLNERVKLVTREGELWGTAQEEALRQGNLVHNILSETDTLEDLPTALEKYRKKE